jgi:hypothetical protein
MSEVDGSFDSRLNGIRPRSSHFGITYTQKRFKQAVDLAIADYLKRNTSILELQRRFNLATYDLITKAEEKAVLDKGVSGCACRVFQQKYGGYERWVELSAVGFNQDQTVAVVYVVEWRGDGTPCSARRRTQFIRRKSVAIVEVARDETGDVMSVMAIFNSCPLMEPNLSAFIDMSH